MEYTTNYHLPQWVETDRIMMGDFNQMCSDIEAGLTEAQATADAAQETANTLPYTSGSISIPSGEEVGIDLITFPFKPSAILFVTGSSVSMFHPNNYSNKIITNDISGSGSGTYRTVTVVLSGNTLKIQSRSSTVGGVVFYMAFR